METAAYLAVSIFNEGASSLLKVMATMGVTVGRNAAQFALSNDIRRCSQADIRAQHATREARIQRRIAKNQKEEDNITEEGLFYVPGIDDFM